jgi:hypothetical protein
MIAVFEIMELLLPWQPAGASFPIRTTSVHVFTEHEQPYLLFYSRQDDMSPGHVLLY